MFQFFSAVFIAAYFYALPCGARPTETKRFLFRKQCENEVGLYLNLNGKLSELFIEQSRCVFSRPIDLHGLVTDEVGLAQSMWPIVGALYRTIKTCFQPPY